MSKSCCMYVLLHHRQYRPLGRYNHIVGWGKGRSVSYKFLLYVCLSFFIAHGYAAPIPSASGDYMVPCAAGCQLVVASLGV